MKDTNTAEPDIENAEESMSARFAHLVVQQSSMAMMLLGKAPHPESGEVVRDLNAARFFIDQLEMLELKTRGNLNEQEAALLKQTLMSLRMAFVECVNAPPAAQPAGQPAPEAGAARQPPGPAPAPEGAPAEHESSKRFTKKY
jgi:uncharacterized membrane protein YccC